MFPSTWFDAHFHFVQKLDDKNWKTWIDKSKMQSKQTKQINHDEHEARDLNVH